MKCLFNIKFLDTRSITRKIRKYGVLKAGFTDNKEEIESLAANLKLQNYLVMR